jgi:hypothetical protein
MADVPVFQGHHVIEQAAFAQSRLLQSLSRSGLFDLHGPRNIINLPADQALAARMGLSPHPGGPLGAYTDELATALRDLQMSPDGQATLRGDQAAAQRIATRVNGLTDTLKVGLVNGDLVSNTPQGLTPEQANARIRTFFGDLDGYQRTHAGQITELGRMSASEARWAGVTRSEGNVRAALDAIDQPGRSTLSERWGGRPSLGTAIADANQAGRLPLSEPVAARLRVAFPQEMPPILARPPTAPRVPGLPEEGVVPETAGPRGTTPGGGRAMRVVGGAGLALMAYDFAVTGHRVVQLRAQGNEAGAASAQTHFVGRNAGGIIGGFGAGFLYGAIAGSETGPGALLTGLAGGVAGAYLGERWADRQDIARVYTQPDGAGNEWTRNPEDPQGAWTRSVRAPTPSGGSQDTPLVAAGRLADELNYRAANDSYSLGLANPPRPENPFSIAGAQDQPGWHAGPWQRDAQSGQWSRTLAAEGMLSEYQMIPEMRTDRATPAQTADLERQSQIIVAQNAMNTPAALAARYDVASAQFNWQEFAAREPVLAAIANARTQTQTLQASDGSTYTRAADGTWSTPGTLYGTNAATGNIREELNRTWQSQREGLQDLAALQQQARANPIPQPDSLRGQVVSAYANAHVPRSDAQIDAATTAVRQTHARTGVDPVAPFFLQVRPDGSIATVSGRDDNRMEVRSVTTAAEIARAQTQPQPISPATPRPDAPPPAPIAPQPDAPAPTRDRAALDPVRGAEPVVALASAVTPPGARDAAPLRAAGAMPDATLPDPGRPTMANPVLGLDARDARDPRDPEHPRHADFDRIRTAMQAGGRWNEQQVLNISADLLNRFDADGVNRRLDRALVGNALPDGRVNAFAVYEPWGPNRERLHTEVDTARSAQIPASTSFAQMQEREQARSVQPPVLAANRDETQERAGRAI